MISGTDDSQGEKAGCFKEKVGIEGNKEGLGRLHSEDDVFIILLFLHNNNTYFIKSNRACLQFCLSEEKST